MSPKAYPLEDPAKLLVPGCFSLILNVHFRNSCQYIEVAPVCKTCLCHWHQGAPPKADSGRSPTGCSPWTCRSCTGRSSFSCHSAFGHVRRYCWPLGLSSSTYSRPLFHAGSWLEKFTRLLNCTLLRHQARLPYVLILNIRLCGDLRLCWASGLSIHLEKWWDHCESWALCRRTLLQKERSCRSLYTGTFIPSVTVLFAQ